MMLELKNLTDEELHNFHIQLWDFMSKNPEKDKKDWEGWRDFEDSISDLYWIHYCFACYSVNENCKKCPLEWPRKRICIDERSLYYAWIDVSASYICSHHLRDALKTSRIARQIRDLPWNKK